MAESESAPTGRSIAVAAEAIRAYLGDPRDWPIGAESALRGDLLFAAAEAILDEAIASDRLFTRGYLDKVVGSYEERIRVGRQENERQRARIEEGSRALAEAAEAAREKSQELQAANRQIAAFEAAEQDRERVVEHLRRSEEELTIKLAELQREATDRRDGYFRHVEKIEREREELRGLLASSEARLRAFEEIGSSPEETALARARLDLAERLAVWLDTNPSNKGGPYERGFEKAIDLLKDLGELPAAGEEERAVGPFEIVEGARS